MSYSAQHARDSLDQMNSLLSRIVNLSKDIGTFHDGVHLREQIQTSVQDLLQLSRSVKTEIETLRSQDGDSSESASLHAAFEALSVKMKGSLPDVVASLRSAENPQQTNLSYIEPAPQQKNKLPLELINTPLLDQTVIDQETDQLDLLESEVNTILNQMREINTLFNKTMEQIQADRHKVANIGAITSKAAKDMKNGNIQLEKAEGHMKGTRKALCIIFIIVLVICLAVGGFLAYYFLKLKKNKDGGSGGDGKNTTKPYQKYH